MIKKMYKIEWSRSYITSGDKWVEAETPEDARDWVAANMGGFDGHFAHDHTSDTIEIVDEAY